MTPEQYDAMANWAFEEFKNQHTTNSEVREDLRRHQERHNAAGQDFQSLYARMWEVEQRLETAEGRLATLAAEVTQLAVTVNRVAEVAQSANTQARTDYSIVTMRLPKPRPLTSF